MCGGGIPKLSFRITGLEIPNGDQPLRLQLSTLEVNSNLHICNCHARRQLKLASQYTSISNWPLLTWRWHLRSRGKRYIMTFLYVLSLLIIGFTITFGTVILPWKPAPLISFWKECDGYEWRNDWTPGIPLGSCVNQHRNGHHVYVDRQGPWRKWCPSPIYCLPTEQHRKKCKNCTIS